MENYLKFTYYRNTMGNLVIVYGNTSTQVYLLSSQGTDYCTTHDKVQETYEKVYDADRKRFYENIHLNHLKELLYQAVQKGLLPLSTLLDEVNTKEDVKITLSVPTGFGKANIFPRNRLQAQLDYLKDEELLITINIK